MTRKNRMHHTSSSHFNHSSITGISIARSQALFTLCALLLSLAATGCATPLSHFGDQARYSPAYRGYVLATHNGSDDPDAGNPVLILRDPLTGNKLRCQEQVEQWREVLEDLAIDQVEDDNAAIVAAATTGVALAPVMALQPTGSLGTLEAMLIGGQIYDALSSEDGQQLLLRGIILYKRTRYASAAKLFERALLKDPSVGILGKAYFYLGMAYAKQGNDERSRLALALFIERAGVRDVNAYREAEVMLEELGERYDACDSEEPVQVYW